MTFGCPGIYFGKVGNFVYVLIKLLMDSLINVWQLTVGYSVEAIKLLIKLLIDSLIDVLQLTVGYSVEAIKLLIKLLI